MSEVTLSKAVRSNLLHLQNTSDLMSKTQERLATGKKVNSALDNPTNFFTASSLNARASDMGALLDSMANGIQTIEAADNGLTAITKTLESMQSTLTQARQDKSFKWASYTINDDNFGSTDTLDFSGGAVGTASIELGRDVVAATLTGAGGANYGGDPDLSTLDGETITLDDGQGNTASYTFTAATAGQAAALEAALDVNNFDVTLTANGIDVSRTDGQNFTLTTSNAAVGTSIGIANGTTSNDGVVAGTKDIDTLVTAINNDTTLNTAIRASNDDGKLRIENFSTQDLDITQPAGVSGANTIGGNTVRTELAKQYNELRDQLDKLSDDASFNGVNLLRGDNLQLTFNETGTSEINVQTTDGEAINSANLGIQTSLTAPQLDSDADIEGFITEIKGALHKVQSQSSSFGSNLSIVENRQEFTKQMINTLDAGASNLTLADSNEEAANLLALQTRQQLSSTALSMASQADQNVLRLFQ